MKKLSMLLVAVLAVALMMGFVGCKQEDDTPAGPAVVTTWEDATDPEMVMTLYIYGDNTWKLVMSAEGQSLDALKGTYTGDSTKNGDLTCKVTEVNPAAGMEGFVKKDASYPATIKDNKITVTLEELESFPVIFEFTKK